MIIDHEKRLAGHMNLLKTVVMAYPYHPTDFMMISHPLVTSSVLPLEAFGDIAKDVFRRHGEIMGDFVMVNERNFSYIVSYLFEKMMAGRTPEQMYALLNKTYCLDVLNVTKRWLTLSEYSNILRDAWMACEWPGQMNTRDLVRMFKWADRSILMTATELAVYNMHLKNTASVVLYRGIGLTVKNHERFVRKLSWTLDFEKARWFATRHGSGVVYQAVISKPNAKVVLAYFDDRGESEVVINPLSKSVSIWQVACFTAVEI
jgi:hypothetical protein